MLWAGHAQAALEQALRMLPTLGSTAGTPNHLAKVWGGWWKGGSRMCLTRGCLSLLQTCQRCPGQWLSDRFPAGLAGFRRDFGRVSVQPSLSISHLSEMPLLCLDLKDGHLKPSP